MHTSPFTLFSGSCFEYLPEKQSICFDPVRMATIDGKYRFLHELAHALLSHKVPTDDQRYAVERDAWVLARELARALNLPPREGLISSSLRDLARDGFLPNVDL